jgi:hypothetical protein
VGSDLRKMLVQRNHWREPLGSDLRKMLVQLLVLLGSDLGATAVLLGSDLRNMLNMLVQLKSS